MDSQWYHVSMPRQPQRHDLQAYHRSITAELHTLKNRIRNLVDHWPTDGEYKEVALRSVMRRHVPQSLMVGRGFVVNKDATSRQVDVLVADRSKPTLFHDGDLMIVTPDAVRAIIEVKTEIRTPSKWREAIQQIAENAAVTVKGRAVYPPWLGLFVFEGNDDNDEIILDALEDVYGKTGIAINCVAWGKSGFIRFWEGGHLPVERDLNQYGRWRSYKLKNLAPAYFLGNFLIHGAPENLESGYAWFPLREGKEEYRRSDRPVTRVEREA